MEFDIRSKPNSMQSNPPRRAALSNGRRLAKRMAGLGNLPPPTSDTITKMTFAENYSRKYRDEGESQIFVTALFHELIDVHAANLQSFEGG